MRGLSGAILILLLAGGAIVYLALEKFAPRKPCNCEKECQVAVSSSPPIVGTDDPPQPPDESGSDKTALDDDWAIKEQEIARLETWDDELENKAQRLDEWEQNLKRKETELREAEQGLIERQTSLMETQIELENKLNEVDQSKNKIEAVIESLLEQHKFVRQAKLELESLQIGILIMADLVLIVALLVLGLSLLRRWRTRLPHPEPSM